MTNKTFCCLPWVHLATHPHGGATLCCISDHTHSMNRARNFISTKTEFLDLNNHSVEQIMNSDYYRETRLKMLAGDEVQACKRCYVEEQNNIASKRINENKQFGFTVDDAKQATLPTGEINPRFKFIELRLGNICNVKCRTCNPASSSAISTEYKILQKSLRFVTQYDDRINASWTDSDKFWDELFEKSTDLELLYINGGEPTLVEKHWTKYLQRLIDAGLHKQITLWYNLNMTNLPDRLIEIWSQFKNVKVSCSIDDLGKRNEYLRTGTKWETVITNLDKLQSHKWIETSICQTVSWLNAGTLKEFDDFMAQRGLHVHLNLVHDPKFLSISVWPRDVVEILANTCGLSQYKKDMISSMIVPEPEYDNSLLSKGMEYVDWLDASRSTSYKDVYGRPAF